MKSTDVEDLLVQAKTTNRLLAAQFRSSLGQKKLVGLLMSVGATHWDIAEVLGTSAAAVKATVGGLRKEKKKRPAVNAWQGGGRRTNG